MPRTKRKTDTPREAGATQHRLATGASALWSAVERLEVFKAHHRTELMGYQSALRYFVKDDAERRTLRALYHLVRAELELAIEGSTWTVVDYDYGGARAIVALDDLYDAIAEDEASPCSNASQRQSVARRACMRRDPERSQGSLCMGNNYCTRHECAKFSWRGSEKPISGLPPKVIRLAWAQ